MPREQLPWLARIVVDGIRLGAQALHKQKGPVRKLKIREFDPALKVGDVVLVSEITGNETSSVQLDSEPLASADSPLGALYTLCAQHRLRLSYTPQALAEAEAFTHNSGIDDSALVDMTHRPYITIDNDDSRDLDQALHIESTNEGFLVSYALADASYYVQSGSALFQEALARGASYYLPGLSVPMLPRLLSEDLVSLNPQKIRRALVFEMRLDEYGNCIETQIVRARIRSRAKLTYAGVQAYYDNPAASSLNSQQYTPSLDLLRTVGQLRRSLAEAKHVVDYNRTGVRIDRTEHVFTTLADNRLWVERYNEQISLMCNVEGAKLLNSGVDNPALQAVYRVHPAPPPEKLERFEYLILDIIQAFGLSPADWSWHRTDSEPLAKYLRRLPGRCAEASDREQRIAAVIERQAIMTNIRSSFDSEPGEHHGIGAPCYARFSSPMREVVGIFTHKELLEHLMLEKEVLSPASDCALRDLVIQAGNDSKALQKRLRKEANKLAIDALLGPQLIQSVPSRSRFVGTIMGTKRSCMYVQLDAPPLELKVYWVHLNQQYDAPYTLQENGVKVSGSESSPTFRLGQRVELSVRAYHPDTGQWEFNIHSDP